MSHFIHWLDTARLHIVDWAFVALQWGPNRQIVKGMNYEARTAFRGYINELVKRTSQCPNLLSLCLNHALPTIATYGTELTVMNKNFIILDTLVDCLATRYLKWDQISGEHFVALVKDAIHARDQGQSFRVEVSQEDGHYEQQDLNYCPGHYFGGGGLTDVYVVDSPQEIKIVVEPKHNELNSV